MQHLWKAGWRVLALGTGALLILLAGLAARTPGVGVALQSAHTRHQGAVHQKALPLPAPNATLDQANPASGYATAMWSGGPQQQSLIAYARLDQLSIPVPYGVKTVFNPALALGYDKVSQPGADGTAVETVRRLFENNQLVAVSTISEQVVHPAQPELVQVGAKIPEVSRGQILGRVVKMLNVVATAYWADPSWSNGNTATGVKARYGVIAVDPSVIPLGTRLYVPGYGYGVAADTGSAIIGDRIDLCYDTGQQAIDYGRQSVTVYILSSN